MEKINLNGLKKVLSEEEMKNVLGGSGGDNGKENCGWEGCSLAPCLINWSGTCDSCEAFGNNTCVNHATKAWCYN